MEYVKTSEVSDTTPPPAPFRVRMMERGDQAKPARVFGFDDIAEAHQVMESGQAGGKMVVAVK